MIRTSHLAPTEIRASPVPSTRSFRARVVGAVAVTLSLALPGDAHARALPLPVPLPLTGSQHKPGAVPEGEGTTEGGQGRTTTRRRARRTVRTSPLTYTTPRTTAALTGDLGSMLMKRVRNGRWGVMVVSLTRGDTLYAFNPDDGLQPASNMKLFTSALVLDQLGPDHQFSTDVLRDGTLSSDGALRGNLVIRGDGDPSLSARFFQGNARAMDALAQLVAAAGVKRVTGNLIADASAFDPERIPEGWKSRYLSAGYAARVSALSLNENLVTLVVRAGSGTSGATVSFDPATDLPLAVGVRTVNGSGARVIVHTTSAGVVEVRGWIGRSTGERRYQMVVEDPTAYAAGAFRRALQSRGISVAGKTQYATTPGSATKIASLQSPPLTRLLAAMNGESINHYAELLFRDAARHASPSGVGSAEAGNALLQQFMSEKVGASPGAVFTSDGSGLSVLDRVTPRSLVQLLSYANHSSWSDAFHSSLPVAGESDLLRHRMRSTPAQGNLHAKTGTTNTVTSLGGYVTAKNGELLAFAFIYNGRERWNAKETIDAMGATLAAFSRQ